MFVLCVCVAALVILVQHHWVLMSDAGVFVLSYLFSSLFLSPDLDMRQSLAYRRWRIGRTLWLPYSRMFRHRRLSHHPVVGPLTRIVYMGVIVLLFLVVASLTIGKKLDPWGAIKPVAIPILLGLYLPNEIHILIDALWSFAKRLRRL